MSDTRDMQEAARRTPYAARRTEWRNGSRVAAPTITRHADIASANEQRHAWIIDELIMGGTATYSKIHDEFRAETIRGTAIFLSVHAGAEAGE